MKRPGLDRSKLKRRSTIKRVSERHAKDSARQRAKTGKYGGEEVSLIDCVRCGNASFESPQRIGLDDAGMPGFVCTPCLKSVAGADVIFRLATGDNYNFYRARHADDDNWKLDHPWGGVNMSPIRSGQNMTITHEGRIPWQRLTGKDLQ